MKKVLFVSVLAVALVLGLATTAIAGPPAVFGPGTAPIDNSSNPVNVRATVNPRVQMTITCPDATQTVDFGTLNPEDTVASGSNDVTILVKSNQNYHLAKTIATPSVISALGISMTYADGSSTAGTPSAGGTTYTDSYWIPAPGVPWTTTPGDYNTNVTYTVTVP